MAKHIALGLTALMITAASVPAGAQVAPATTTANTTPTTTTGSAGCALITQAAATGMTNRIAADDKSINPPMSVTSLTCLNNFFNGVGLNLVTSLMDPSKLLAAVVGQICNIVKTGWNSLLGASQSGLTVTGFNFGLGLGAGFSCPKNTFGGGGPPIGSLGIGLTGKGSGLYINGKPVSPAGYTPITNPNGTF